MPTRAPEVADPDAEGTAASAGARAVKAAANGKPTPEQARDALAWLLSADEAETENDPTADYLELELDVGSGGNELWVKWTIKPVPLEKLRAVQREALGGNRQQRRAGVAPEADETESNLRVIIEGTVDPDITQAAIEAGIASPVTFLRRRLQKTPGLIPVISGRIMALSGFDADRVRLPQGTAAAGNS